MKNLLLAMLQLAVTTAKLCRPGGVRAVIAENLLLKQQLIKQLFAKTGTHRQAELIRVLLTTMQIEC